jgi:hypothetical protein
LNKYSEKAAELQRMVRADEIEMGMDYGEDQVRQSIVHMREDVVLLVSHMSSINQQLASIRRLAWVGVLALIFIALAVGSKT